MSVRKLLAVLGIAAATSVVGAAAHATTFDYSISGSIAGELISGSGVGSYSVSGGLQDLTFTVTGPGPIAAGTYTDSVSFSSPNDIHFVDGSGPGAPVLIFTSLIPLSNSHLFTSGGFGIYNVGNGVIGRHGIEQLAGAGIGVQISAVPLPGAVVLFGSAIAGLGGFGFLRRRSA